MTLLSWRAIWVGSCIVCLGSGCARHDSSESSKPKALPLVSTVSVKRGSIEHVLDLSGKLVAVHNQEAVVVPTVSGVLESLPVAVGQDVRKGQVVGRIAPQAVLGQIQQATATVGQNQVQVEQAQVGEIQQQAQVETAIQQARSAAANAQATLAATQATLVGNEAAVRNAQQSLQREETLFAEGLVARKDLETAQLAVRTAQAQATAQRRLVEAQRQTVIGQVDAINAAKAGALQVVVKHKDVAIARQQVRNARGQLQSAQAQLAQYTLRAPLNGQVVSITSNVGETVDTTTKLLTVANLSTLQLQVAIPAASASQVHPGQTVRFQVEAITGKQWQAALQIVGTQVDAATGTVSAAAVVRNFGRQFRDDQAAKATLVLARHDNVLIVPRSAVLVDPVTGSATVSIVDAKNILHVRPVTTGLRTADEVEIVAGAAYGDHVAVSQQYGVPDGTAVSSRPAGGEPTQGASHAP